MKPFPAGSFFHGDRCSVPGGEKQRFQLRLLHQGAHIGAHAGVDRAVPACYGKAGGEDLPFLENIVGQKDPSASEQAKGMGQISDILSLGSIHKDQVEGRVLPDPAEDLLCVALQKFD